MKTFKPLPTVKTSPSPPKNGFGVFIGLGLIFLGAGIGVTSKLSTLTCSRVELDRINCSTVEEDLLELNVKTTNLDRLQRAEVQISVKTEGETEKLVLVGQNQEIQPEAFEGDAQEAALKLNDFIADLNEESIVLTKDARWFSCFFGSVLAVVGLFQSGLLKFSPPRNFNRS